MNLPTNLNEECLLDFLRESPQAMMAGGSSPQLSELEAMRPVFRRNRYVSFPASILLQKVQGLFA